MPNRSVTIGTIMDDRPQPSVTASFRTAPTPEVEPEPSLVEVVRMCGDVIAAVGLLGALVVSEVTTRGAAAVIRGALATATFADRCGAWAAHHSTVLLARTEPVSASNSARVKTDGTTGGGLYANGQNFCGVERDALH